MSNLGDLQKALDNRPSFPLAVKYEDSLEQWFEDFTKKFAVFKAELELPVGEWLTKKAKTLYELYSLAKGLYDINTKITFSDKTEIIQKKWVSVETVTALLMKVFSEHGYLDNFLNTVEMKIITTLGSDPTFLLLSEEKRKFFLGVIQKQFIEPRKFLLELLPEKLLVDRKQLEPFNHIFDNLERMTALNVLVNGEELLRLKELLEGSVRIEAELRLLDIANMQNCSPEVKDGLHSVSEGKIFWTQNNKVTCREHGACNCVNKERTIWRCLTCHEGAYVPKGSGEHLNLALAFADVKKKKKGSGSVKK